MSLNGGGDMRTRGLEVIKVALAFDNEGKYPEAVQKYTQGIEYLMTAKKYESGRKSPPEAASTCSERGRV